ncbi:MAG TPA: nitrous oxide reductase accessory protein NosL [Burkholderiaceae bacterium]|nr:nitrous oxide reductase accessory protein NosL [Burkholderiaceae bacterium]
MNIGFNISRRALRACLGGVAILGLLAACSQQLSKVSALEAEDGTACALDGMLLKDYPGPKAQMHYAEGEPDFYCDLMDLFSMLLAPEQKRTVAAVFVQDMGKAEWEHPSGNWIDAKSALYVAGSSKTGAMGATLASFANRADAEAFAAKEGGKVVRFEQVTLEMVQARDSGKAHGGHGMH